ncbi:MAG: glycosyltransferase family protein [Bacteroidia bacterium]
MRVSGFTIVRNAVTFDYPVVEAITSVLPLCDEFIVNVGDCGDGTLALILSINSPKIKIIQSTWDDNLREGGKLLAVETNRAFDALSADSHWAFYIQADEVLHEKYVDTVRAGMEAHKYNLHVEGLLFDYTHFYGSYDYVGNSRRWYRNEIRVIRNDKEIRSYKDAQGFRKNGEKLHVKPLDASIYHYGWVKPPKAQQEKQKSFHKMWHDDAQVKSMVTTADEFDYSTIDSLTKFTLTHPAVMQKRIKQQNWDFTFNTSKLNLPLKDKLLLQIEKLTGWRVGENKNFKVV